MQAIAAKFASRIAINAAGKWDFFPSRLRWRVLLSTCSGVDRTVRFALKMGRDANRLRPRHDASEFFDADFFHSRNTSKSTQKFCSCSRADSQVARQSVSRSARFGAACESRRRSDAFHRGFAGPNARPASDDSACRIVFLAEDVNNFFSLRDARHRLIDDSPDFLERLRCRVKLTDAAINQN